MRSETNQTPRTNYQLVTRGGIAVGWVNPATGAYTEITEAGRRDPPGQPVGSFKPLSQYWGDWP